MSMPGKLNDGRYTEYGLGLMIANHKGHREIGHSGATGGFKAHMGIFPEDDMAVIVLANASDIYSRTVAREIADIYLKPTATAAVTPQVTQVPQDQQTKAADSLPFDKANVSLDQYTGTYYSDELETFYQTA